MQNLVLQFDPTAIVRLQELQLQHTRPLHPFEAKPLMAGSSEGLLYRYNLRHSVTRLHHNISLPVCVLSVFHATKSTPLSDPEAVSVVQGKDRTAK